MLGDDKCQILWQHREDQRRGSGLLLLYGEWSEKDLSDSGACEQSWRTWGLGRGYLRATLPGAGAEAPRWECARRVSGRGRRPAWLLLREHLGGGGGKARGEMRQRAVGIHRLRLLPWQSGKLLPHFQQRSYMIWSMASIEVHAGCFPQGHSGCCAEDGL